ncbi:MAG: thioredoxin [Candidatus Aminicenantales bacterium]
MAENISSISDESFEEEVLKSELPVLVDFWASWCAPCLMIAPALENIAQLYKDKMKIRKLNVDENPKTPAKYGIMSIPSLLIFKQGELKETIVGALPQDKIIELISKHL